MCVHTFKSTNMEVFLQGLAEGGTCTYEVATISRLLKIIGLFCKRAL